MSLPVVQFQVTRSGFTTGMLTHPARHALGHRFNESEATVAVRLMRPTAVLLMGWLLLSGVLLAARSIVATVHPLGAGPLMAAGLALAVTAWLARAAWTIGRPGRRASTFARLLPRMLTSSALLLWGACLTRGVSFPAAAIFWLVLIGEEGWSWHGQLTAFRRASSPGRRPSTSRGDVLLQQYTRLLTLDGEEVVRGSLSITIDKGSRWAAGHVAFCPPLIESPEFDVQLDMPPRAVENATLKVSQLYPHGARIEARLPQPAMADTTLAVQFVARAPRATLTSG